MSINLLTSYTMRGRTLRLNIHATSVNCNSLTATSDDFDIDELVKVRVKVDHDYGTGYHIIALSTMLHELAKDEMVKVNVLCDKTKFADKWICSGKWTEWIVIGKCNNIRVPCSHTNCGTYVSITEITISVYKITTYKPNTLCEDSDFTDFTLSAADGHVDVHRACLAAHSPVFKAMFTGAWKETKENLIEIKGHTRQTLQNLKDFLYLGTLPDEGLHTLMTLAVLYSIDDLKKECVRKLVETVQPEDLYSLHELACENNIPELSYALAQLTVDEVFNKAHQLKKNNENKKQTQTQ